MFIKLLGIFILVPILELYLLIEVGRTIGAEWTILLILLTGIAGAWLARTQGVDVLRRIQQDAARGDMPAGPLLEGVLILVGGLLLLTPGFCTDLIGFSCLVPSTRSFCRKLLVTWLQREIDRGTIHIRRHKP